MTGVSNPNHHSDYSREIIPVGLDNISSLPDTILHNILSSFPTKFVIRTSVLSKRWKRVWQEIPSISIECHRGDHVDLIDKTLTSYSTLKITSFDVSIKYIIYKVPLDRWIELAMSRNAVYMSLRLGNYYSIIPDLFYVNSSVKQLSLTSADLVPKSMVSWPSLMNLSLDGCNLPGESIANIFSGCPMLESLILNKCSVVQRLDLSRLVNLTRFDITERGSFSEPEEIVAPHIRYLSLTNILKQDNLVDISSLTEAKFNLDYCEYRGMEADLLQHSVLKMLEKLQSVDKLTIGVVVLQILSLAEVRGGFFPQLQIKALTLETMLVRSVIPGIIRLLQNSPGLEKITVNTTNSNVISNKDLKIYLGTGNFNDQCWKDLFPKVEKTSSSFNSRHVEFFMKLVMCKAWTLKRTDYQNLFSMVPLIKDGEGKAIFDSFEIKI